MPQLNVTVFYDAVFISVLFVVGFIFFLKFLLPLFSFFAKKDNYLMVYLLSEVNSEDSMIDVNKPMLLSVRLCNNYINTVYSSYCNFIEYNSVFYGVYLYARRG